MRIVSLLPSATEIVCSLGLESQLVGISHCCDYPPSITHLPVMTRTSIPKNAPSDVVDEHVRHYLGDHTALYQLNLDQLEQVQADVVVSQRLCDVCAVSTDDVQAALATISTKPTLIDLEPEVLEDVFADIERVGKALKHSEQAKQLIASLKSRVARTAQLTATIPVSSRPRVALLEWLLPPFNSGHWNPELVELAGGIDCLGPKGMPSTTVTWEQVEASDPDVIVVACCGYDQKRAQKDLTLLSENNLWQKLVKKVNGQIFVADGDAWFSRPGPRLIDGMEALAHALHPTVHPPNGLEKSIYV